MIYKFTTLKRGAIVIQEDLNYIFKGSLGFSQYLPKHKKIFIKDNDSHILLQSFDKSLFFLYKKLIKQKIKGVLFGFKKKLRLEGIGYIAVLNGQYLTLKLGYSHPINIKIPSSIKIHIKKRKKLTLLGSDLNDVTQFAFNIRKYKIPEIYKGKGILYFKEKIRLKIGKKN
jgi:large subunit ribosomal protein L6